MTRFFPAKTITFTIIIQCNSIFVQKYSFQGYPTKKEKSRKFQREGEYDKHPLQWKFQRGEKMRGSKAKVPSVRGYGYFMEPHIIYIFFYS